MRSLLPGRRAVTYTPTNDDAASPDSSAVPVAVPNVATRSPLAMRPLPPRGDRQARWYWLLGVAAYVLISAALIGALTLRGGAFDAREIPALFGVGDHPNFAVALLVGLGVAVTIIAATRAVADIRLMRAEEDDVEWVRTTGGAALDLVFLDASDRERIFAARQRGESVAIRTPGRVETLLDERVRRVQIALSSADGGVIVPAELRGIAEVRTAAYGAFARYASSLLLLLAVLGTFAGVKTALPKLIEAISSTTSDNQGLVDALNAVASAFGGNALALVGAVSVGLMAQGLTLGRRNLLERLELISAEYLYGRNVAAEADPMQSAIVALRDTAREMQSATGAMLGIEHGLQEMGREFRGSFDALGDRLRDIAVQQEQGMHDRTADALVGLQRRSDALARSVDANAQVYAGLAEAVGRRASDTTEALQQMRETNQQLAQALTSVAAAGEQSATTFRQLQDAMLELRRGTETTDARLDALATAVRGMDPTFAALGSTLAAADARLRASEDAARQGWQQAGEQLTRQLGEVTRELRTFDERTATTLDRLQQTAVARAGAATAGGGDPEVVRLLRELVKVSGARGEMPSARSAWSAALVPFAAVVVGAGVAGAATYFLVHPAQQQAQVVVEQLQPTLDRLGASVDRLQARAPGVSRPNGTPDSTARSGPAAARP